MTMIYHITTLDALKGIRDLLHHKNRCLPRSKSSGEYRAESLASQGFIHFSQIHQLLGVANAFYAGQKDLVILVVDPARLKAELKYEAPVHPSSVPQPPTSEYFPHLYGPLNFDAVIKVVDLVASTDGDFVLPVL